MHDDKVVVLVVNNAVVFPNSEVRIEYSVDYSDIIDKIDDSLDKMFLIVNPLIDSDSKDIMALPNYGVLARLKFKMKVPNGKIRVVLDGVKRVEISNYVMDNDYYFADYKDVIYGEENYDDSYISLVTKSIERYVNLVPHVGNALMNQVSMANNLDSLCDLIAAFLPVSYDKKKHYVTTVSLIDRAKLIVEDMSLDIKFMELEKTIDSEVDRNMNDAQKDFYLREKIKVIQKELGDVNSKDNEVELFRKKLKKLKCSSSVFNKIKYELDRYDTLNSNSMELGMLRDYLDWMFNIPWSKFTKDCNDIKVVNDSLNKTHFALEDVKLRIVEYLAVKQNTKNLRSPILCLVGPPGVGKTTLAYSIGSALGRKICKISVGGINDEAEIIGHRRTYIGANPGRIIKGMRSAGTTNPVFIIDEIDKMSKDIKGDPASSLLEVLDLEQNKYFSDHYIEEAFDLSQVLFVTTANYIDQIPYELLDRLEIIELSSYTEYEKVDIARSHLVPKLLEEHGLTSLQVSISDEVILSLVRHYTKEAGVRELERVIASLFRKIVKKMLFDKDIVFYAIDNNLVEELLGKKKYRHNLINSNNKAGVVNGMAYTYFGGDILTIEATSFLGNGNLVLTGSLGEVMKESAQIALSYVKSLSNEFDIDLNNLVKSDIHIHFPSGAINKDGPSAGIAITTAIISLFKNSLVSESVAMTGEITLSGRVLPIGGLKEKIIGAHRSGIKKIILPKSNKVDLDDIDALIKKDIEFIFVDYYKEVYDVLFSSKGSLDE